MTSNRRVSFGLVADILDALEQHGDSRGDDQHAGLAPSASSATWPGSGRHPRTTRPAPT